MTLRVLPGGERDERPLEPRPEKRRRRSPAERYHGLTARLAEHRWAGPVRRRAVRRGLVVAFLAGFPAAILLSWVGELFTGVGQLAAFVVVATTCLALLVATGLATELPRPWVDERQLAVQRRLRSRAFVALAWLVMPIAILVPNLIDAGVIPPLDGGRAFALVWGVSTAVLMLPLCVEAWSAPSPPDE